MILADKRDYKQGYKTHYTTYKKLQREKSNTNSRRLLLAYSVECGLKYMLLNKWHEDTSQRVLESNDEKRKRILTSRHRSTRNNMVNLWR